MLGSFILLTAIMAVGAVVLTKGTAVLMGKFGGESIRKKHAAAEHIVERGTVPAEWVREMERRYPGLSSSLAYPATGKHEGEGAKTRCLRRLDALSRYFAGSSLVADEETRELILKSLSETRKAWIGSEWAEMVGAGTDGAGSTISP